MPADFITGFFTSAPAGEQYSITSKLFNGAVWVPSPLTDLTLGAKGIQAWWTSKFDALTRLLDDTPDKKNFVAQAQSNSVDRIQLMLGRLFDQANNRSTIEKKDTVAALVNAFQDLQNGLKPLIRAQQDKAKAAPALADLMNASLTASMSAVVTLENDERSKPKVGQPMVDKPDFIATFNELFLRDRATTLSKIVGDLPDSMCYSAQDTPGDYMQLATHQLIQTAQSLEGRAETLANLEKTLSAAKSLSSDKATVLELANNTQFLGQETQRLATVVPTSRDFKEIDQIKNNAGSAAALSGVFVESMRGVLGVASRGTGKLTSALDVGKLIIFGRAAADKIGKDVTHERNVDPLYPDYDPARLCCGTRSSSSLPLPSLMRLPNDHSIAGVTGPGDPARGAVCPSHEVSRWRRAGCGGAGPAGTGAAGPRGADRGRGQRPGGRQAVPGVADERETGGGGRPAAGGRAALASKGAAS